MDPKVSIGPVVLVVSVVLMIVKVIIVPLMTLVPWLDSYCSNGFSLYIAPLVPVIPLVPWIPLVVSTFSFCFLISSLVPVVT